MICNLLANKNVGNKCIIEPPALIVARRRRNLLIERMHAALQQPTSSVESTKEEEKPRCYVVSNANIEFKIIKPIALIEPIALLACVVQRRKSLIFQGITVDKENKVLACNNFVWWAKTNTMVLFEAGIALNAWFFPNIPDNCPNMPILRVKPSGQAQLQNLFWRVASESIRERKQGEEKKALHLADCWFNHPLSLSNQTSLSVELYTQPTVCGIVAIAISFSFKQTLFALWSAPFAFGLGIVLLCIFLPSFWFTTKVKSED